MQSINKFNDLNCLGKKLEWICKDLKSENGF